MFMETKVTYCLVLGESRSFIDDDLFIDLVNALKQHDSGAKLGDEEPTAADDKAAKEKNKTEAAAATDDGSTGGDSVLPSMSVLNAVASIFPDMGTPNDLANKYIELTENKRVVPKECTPNIDGKEGKQKGREREVLFAQIPFAQR
jgi:histone-lysine N-methyltransferase EZH2